MKQDFSKRVVILAVLSRLLCIAIGIVSHNALRLDHQRNTIVFGSEPRPEWLYNIASPFVQWDGIHFLNIAARGYDSVLEHAFFPGLPFTMRGLSALWPWRMDNPTLTLAVSGILFVQLSFVIAALGLYHLSVHILAGPHAALKATLFYIFASSNIFMSAVYTESPFSALTFWGIYMLHVRKNLGMATLLFSLSGLFRSNGILAIGYVLHQALATRRHAFQFIISALAIYAPYYVYSKWSYNMYCEESIGGLRQEWCQTHSSVYAYIQRAFWDVGPFMYWKLDKWPYFALMMPTLLVSLTSVYHWFCDKQKLFTKGVSMKIFKSVIQSREIPYYTQMGVLTIFTVFVANCQILTRILSSCPLYFWTLERIHSGRKTFFSRAIFFAHLAYYLVGPLVFCNGSNWT